MCVQEQRNCTIPAKWKSESTISENNNLLHITVGLFDIIRVIRSQDYLMIF